jgi:hypothetical protein
MQLLHLGATNSHAIVSIIAAQYSNSRHFLVRAVAFRARPSKPVTVVTGFDW